VTPERLSSLDASFLYLEKPAQHMHVAAVSVFDPRPDGPLTYEDVARVFRHRLHLAPRLRQRVLPVPGNVAQPVWVDDDRFDIEFHLRRAALPAPGGRAELGGAVARVVSRQLDRSKPLWELYVYEGLEHDRTAVVMKLHHALADGIGGMLIASALYDLAADTSLGPTQTSPWQPEPPPSSGALLTGALEELVLHPLASMARVVEGPGRAVHAVTEAVKGVGAIAGMGPPPPGPFDVSVGPARRFAMTDVPFEDLRKIKRAHGVTVNDVVLTAVAAGLHDLMRGRGDDTVGRSLRVMVPVSVRSQAQAGDVGNRVAPAFVDVPVGAMSARARLERVRVATSELKHSGMALGVDAIVGLGAYAPGALHATAARLISRGRWFNLVISNVPAPQVPIYLGGARLVASYPVMPLGEHSGLSVACSSLGGTMAFGLTADWDAAPDLDVLTRGISDGVAQLASPTRGPRPTA
jgi:diacylglycerol O-acyltransferase / wax synthase